MEILRAEELSFVYPPEKEALRNINLVISEGDILVITGANGSGKTTLLKCLNGLLRPTSGRVYFKGQDISKLRPQEIFSKVGFLFQNPDDQLFSATVEQDIAFGPKNLNLSEEEINRRIEEVLELLEIKSIRSEPIHDLSQGLKQRVALAGVLAMEPEVLLLDEPTASLDPQTEEEMLLFLKRLNQEKNITLVVATHEMDIIPEFAKNLAIISAGSLVRWGNLGEIFGCEECLKKGRLRLPIVTRLLKSLKEEGILSFDKLPLSFEAAREILKGVISQR
ncbi:MAG: energy-coupling factor ABC transporter ATP-binding protein [Candidatus Omnitrophica bacterium]|nr:energy-coupling factor ABC transporter ATP-binding protein [Candidatus Omnitrophota bacterium]MCM8793237.1 energy-coupling factor ABC transporter ATP-binding protein [Candidatus Omnitrophota bacterium]